MRISFSIKKKFPLLSTFLFPFLVYLPEPVLPDRVTVCLFLHDSFKLYSPKMSRFSPNHINCVTGGKCVLSGISVDERHLRILRISVLAATSALLLQVRALYVVKNIPYLFSVCKM